MNQEIKRLVTLLAAMMATVAFAEDFTFTGSNFEQSNWFDGDAVVGFQDDKTEGGNQFWSTNDAESLAVIKEEVTGKGGLIKEWEGGGDTKVLSIKSKFDGFVCRGVIANEPDGSLTATGVSMDESVYFDGLVEFTALDEVLNPADLDVGLLSVWMFEDEENSVTNLFVTAGYATGEGLIATNYDCGPVSDFSVSPGQWGRLTIKMVSDITDGTKAPGFIVFVNGKPVSFAGAKGDDGTIWSENLTVKAKSWGDKLFPAVSVSDGGGKALFAVHPSSAPVLRALTPRGFVVSVIGTSDGCVRGMGFRGQGKVDELTFASSDVSREFAADPRWLKIPDAGPHYTYVVSNETENVEVDGELVDGTNTYVIAKGSAVKVYFTHEEGYLWDGAFVSPKDLGAIETDTVVDESELPMVLALMGVAAFDAAKTYDGEATNITYVVTNYLGDVIANAAVCLREQGTTAWIPVANFAPYVNVTNATVEVKAEKDGFTTASNKATVVISPRAVTLTSGSESFVYNAQAHSNMTVTVTLTGGAAGVRALPEGEGIVTNGFATITDVGSEPNAFTYAFAEGTKAANYSVSCVTGMLTVTKATIDPTADPDRTWPDVGVDPEDSADIADPTIPFSSFDTTNVYDGVAHTIDTNALETTYTADMFLGNAPSFTYALSSNGTYRATAPAFTDVTVTSVWYKVSAANFEDVIHPAKVIVTNRCVTLTSADGEWPYDAQAHSNMTVTAEGFVEGEGVSTNGFATITDVGTKPNAFDYAFLEGTKAENYSVSCVTGTLTIAGYFVEYNGSGADGSFAAGTMSPDTFGTGIETNLTPCAFTLENFVFSGWTVNGVDKAYDDGAAGKDFAQPGETLSLTALWTRVIVPVSVTNLEHTTVSVTTNGAPVELFDTADGCGIYNVQTNADVTIVYRADSGWAFDASGTNGTVVLPNVTWSVNDFVPEEALPTVVPIGSVITEDDLEDGPDGTVIIKSCKPTADGVLIIPATIGGKAVKAIADKAFQYATWLKELVIENGPTEIGNAAFDNCSGLGRVVIPASVTKVGQVAFMRCFALKTLEFAGNAPEMQKLAKLGYGICWGAHGFDVKTVPGTEGWDVALNTLCEGWQTFSGPTADGVYACTYDPAKVVPRITGVERLSKTDTSLTINNVKKGLTYTLEGAETLDGEWKTLKTAVGGDADTLVFAIPDDTGTSAFFRVTASDGSDK